MKIFIFIITVLLSVSIIVIYRSPQLSCKKYTCLSLSLLNKAKEKEIYENSSKSFRGLYETPEGLLRVESAKLSPKEAENMIKIRLMKMEGLFENARSPYPGPLSDEISCDNKYKPSPKIIDTNTTKITYVSGYLNNRLQYGTCIDDQITHKGFTALFYCQNHQSWYQFEILVPIEKAQKDEYYFKLFQSIVCQRPLENIGKIFP